MKIIGLSKKPLIIAAEIILNGGVIICPTDTVYGFLADATNKKAVDRIYRIKKRSKSKPLAIFVENIKMAKIIAGINGKQEKVLRKYWPGKYTFILKLKIKNFTLTPKFDVGARKSKTNSKNKRLYGITKNTIAMRIPKYKFLNDLLEKIDRPLVQTSVNISTKKPLKNINEISAVFGKNRLIELIIDAGSLKSVKPSKIINLTSNKLKVLR